MTDSPPITAHLGAHTREAGVLAAEVGQGAHGLPVLEGEAAALDDGHGVVVVAVILVHLQQIILFSFARFPKNISQYLHLCNN